MTGPAYRIQTPRMVIRCWDPGDAPLLGTAILDSLDHLLPWMPWAREEPKTLDARIAILRGFRGKFDLGQDFYYALFDPEENTVLGGSGFHTRAGPGATEIGYWIGASHVGRGYATEAAAALTRVAFEIDGVRRVEIRCDPDNERSSAVAQRLGYTREALLRQNGEDVDGFPRDTVLWTLLESEYALSPLRATDLQAFDAAGRILPLAPTVRDSGARIR